MFEHVTFDKLTKITKQIKPYRGSNNHYPVDPYRRHQSYKRFFANGKLYDLADKNKEAFIIEYYGEPLLAVNEDNVVEFIQKYYDQGERMFLTQLCDKPVGSYRQGYWYEGQLVCNDKRRGGNVWVNVLDAKGKYMQMRPIRPEIRYNMLTNEPLVAYDIISPRVDRTKNVDITDKLEYAYKESITPCELVYIPTNDRLQIRLRGEK